MKTVRGRFGFSLLELILALGLSVVVLSAIAGAIRMYMFQLERQSQEIERRTVARGVLRMISDDVRLAIQFKPEDYSGLEDLIASQSLAGLTAGGEADMPVDGEDVDADQLQQQILDAVASGGGPAEGEAQNSGEGEGEDGSGEDGDEEDEEEPELGRPTLIGNQNFLRIDISRLPRLDEYNPLITRRGSNSRLTSDVKSITYYFSQVAPQENDEIDPEFGNRGGLYRRVIDRAVESFQNGDQDIEIVVDPDQYSELVSPEISGIEFRYWDGEDWLPEWNSSEMNGFPSAIELAVIIDPERLTENASFEEVRELDVEVSRTVIYLPVAEIIPPEEEDESDESGEEGGVP